MNLVDEKGRFCFIKNGIVEIDSRLPKYNIVDEKKRKGHASFMRNGSSQPSGVEVDYDDEHPHSSEIVQTEKADDVLRSMVSEELLNEMGKYVSGADAVEFNNFLLNLLSLELEENGYSLMIPESNWTRALSSRVSQDGFIYHNNNNIIQSRITHGYPSSSSVDIFDNIKEKFSSLLKKIKGGISSAKKSVRPLRVLDIFDIVHSIGSENNVFVESMTSYIMLIFRTIKTGQLAQMDRLMQGLIVHIYESILNANGIYKYITFDDIEALQNKCKKVLSISYIHEFDRIIPSSVVDKKVAADRLCVFDNYCVLYYEPDYTKEKPTAKTSKEKRDPVLFGLLNHSEKLYYIDSWVDELCDLTLDEIVVKIGDKKIGDISKDIAKLSK